MNTLRHFRSSPLWLIGLFVLFAEGISAIAAIQLAGWPQSALVIFVIAYASVVTLIFFTFLWWKPENFYSPADYTDSNPAEFINAIRRFPPPQQQTDDAAQRISAAPPAPSQLPPDSIGARFETELRRWLATLQADRREPELISSVVGWQIRWHFEVTYHHILGSQLALLQHLNTEPLSVVRVQEFYERARVTYADYYKDFQFDTWFGWFAQVAGLATKADETISISVDGREFLKYIIERGYQLQKFG